MREEGWVSEKQIGNGKFRRALAFHAIIIVSLSRAAAASLHRAEAAKKFLPKKFSRTGKYYCKCKEVHAVRIPGS